MTIFDSVFWTIILISALAGMVRAVIRIVGNMKQANFTRSEALAWFVRDTLAGIAAGFVAWAVSLAMNNDAGTVLLASVAAFAGVPALEQALRSQGLRDERDLLILSEVEELNTRETLKKKQQELEATQLRLRDAEERLRIANERERLHNELEDLKAQVTRLSGGNTQRDKQDQSQDDDDDTHKTSIHSKK